MIASLPLLLALLAPGPVCGPSAGQELRQALLLELNLRRVQAGRSLLVAHPALCSVSAWRAAEVAASGAVEPDLQILRAITRRIQREGYRPHNWTDSVLLGDRRLPLLEQWMSVRPDWVAQAVEGDFEHLGVGVARRNGQEVISLLLALPQLTVERRQAAPLRQLPRIRSELLAAVNVARRDAGRRPLEPDAGLDEAAQRHAEDMLTRGYYSHRTPEGLTVAARVRAAGYRGARLTSENIAKGLFDPGEVVERWMASSGHRANILRPGVTELGSGVAVGETADGVEVVWVQIFAGR